MWCGVVIFSSVRLWIYMFSFLAFCLLFFLYMHIYIFTCIYVCVDIISRMPFYLIPENDTLFVSSLSEMGRGMVKESKEIVYNNS